MLKRFDALRRPFGQSFDAAVIQVLHITNHLMSRRRALRKEAKADSLHVAADDKSSRDFVCQFYDSLPAPFGRGLG